MLLGAIAAGAVGVRLAFLVWIARPLPRVGDAMAYHLIGRGVAAGRGYLRPFSSFAVDSAEYPPVHPALLALADLAGIDGTMGQRALGAVLGVFGVVMTGVAGRAVGGRACGLLAAAIVAVHPIVIGHDTTLLSEGLALGFGASAILLALRLRDRPAIPAALALGALGGFAALVRGEALLLVVALGVPAAIAWCRPRWSAACVVVGCVAVVLPWTVRNAVVFDEFVPVSTNVSTAIAGANCERTYGGSLVGYWVYGDDCFAGYDERQVTVDGEPAVAARARATGVEYLRSHLGDLPRVLSARAARVWGLWSIDQQAFLAATEGKSAGAERVGTVFGWALLPLSVCGLVSLVRRGEERMVAWVVAAPLLVVTATALVTYGNPRFRATAEPAIAILAALALARRST